MGRRRLFPSTPLPPSLLRLVPYAESADSCDSLVLIRLNRDVTSPSFRFDSRADVSLIHQTGRAGEGKKGEGEGGLTTTGRPPFDVAPIYVWYDRVTGVTEARRERADSSLDRAPSSSLLERLLETKICDKETDEISVSSDSDIAQIGRIDVCRQLRRTMLESTFSLFSYSWRWETKLTFPSTNSIFRAFGFVAGTILLYLRYMQQGFVKCQVSHICIKMESWENIKYEVYKIRGFYKFNEYYLQRI